jgi:hypothetical protein
MHRLAQIFGATTLVGLVAVCSNAAAAPVGLTSSTAAPAASASDAPAAVRPRNGT